MTRLTDDELRRNLGRRANRQALSTDDRNELLSTISQGARNQRRPIHLFGWPLAPVASAAAAALVLVVTGSLLLARVVPSPGPAGTPVVPSATPSIARPSQSPGELELRIYTTAETSELAADPANEGRVVIVALDPRWPCPGDVSCEDDGFMAVHLAGDAAFVGAVSLMEGARPWTVPGVRASASDRQLGLLVIDAWLGRAPAHRSGPTFVDERYGPGAENYLLPDGRQIAERTPGGMHIAFPSDGMRVQNGAYEAFANVPLIDGDGLWAPRRGIYLVRPADCASVLQPTPTPSPWLNPGTAGDGCDYWEIVARVEPPLAHAVGPTPSTSPTGSQHEILGAVAEWIAGREQPFERSVSVHSVVAEVGFLLNTYGPGARDPELRDAGAPLFEGPMTDSTLEAIELALAPTAAEFIADPDAIRDPNREPGICKPFLGERFLVQLGPARPTAEGDGYFVTVQIGNGCHGWTRVVEVTAVDGEYLVTRVVLDGGFIVD